MADARHGTEPREEAEERGADAQAELWALALLNPLAAGELVAQHEGAGRRRVDDLKAGLDLPRSGKELREIDARLPVNRGGERGDVQHAAPAARDGRVRNVEFLALAAGRVVRGDAVVHIPAADTKRCLEPDGGLPRVGKQRQRVHTIRTDDRQVGPRRVELLRVGV